MYYKECNILNIQNILYIHYKEATRRTTEAEKFHHQSSAIQRLCNSSSCIIRSESKGLRTKETNGVNLSPKAKDSCPSSYNQAERNKCSPPTTSFPRP